MTGIGADRCPDRHEKVLVTGRFQRARPAQQFQPLAVDARQNQSYASGPELAGHLRQGIGAVRCRSPAWSQDRARRRTGQTRRPCARSEPCRQPRRRRRAVRGSLPPGCPEPRLPQDGRAHPPRRGRSRRRPCVGPAIVRRTRSGAAVVVRGRAPTFRRGCRAASSTVRRIRAPRSVRRARRRCNGRGRPAPRSGGSPRDT